MTRRAFWFAVACAAAGCGAPEEQPTASAPQPFPCARVVTTDALRQATGEPTFGDAPKQSSGYPTTCTWAGKGGMTLMIEVDDPDGYAGFKDFFMTKAGRETNAVGSKAWANPDMVWYAYDVGFVTRDGRHAVLVELGGVPADLVTQSGLDIEPATPELALAIAKEVDATMSAE